MKKISVLDLYCGLGGLSLGFEMTSAFRVLAGIDNYKWALKTFYNHHVCESEFLTVPQDLSSLDPREVVDLLGETPDVIVGGPPCQGFSGAGKRLEAYIDDPRNKQVFRFLHYVCQLRPRVFLMENVRGIRTTGQSRKNELLDHLIDQYVANGYSISWRVLNSAEYRVPQKRPRFVMVGVLGDSVDRFTFPEPPCGSSQDLFKHKEQFYSSSDALSDLPTPERAEPQQYQSDPFTSLQAFLRDGSDALFNHLVTNHAPETIEKLRDQEVGTRLYDWNHSWYKLDPAAPSPTIKMNNRAPAVHYSEPRLISPRECARLQTIPDRIVLAGNKTQQLTQVGNAVPSIMAAHLATAIAEQCFSVVPPVRWNTFNNPLNSFEHTDMHVSESLRG